MHKELSVKSRVRGDFHARFCERVRVKLSRSTRPMSQTPSKKYVDINGKVSKGKWQSMFRYFARYVDILKSEGQMDRFPQPMLNAFIGKKLQKVLGFIGKKL